MAAATVLFVNLNRSVFCIRAPILPERHRAPLPPHLYREELN